LLKKLAGKAAVKMQQPTAPKKVVAAEAVPFGQFC
jgi:hypothetical protein